MGLKKRTEVGIALVIVLLVITVLVGLTIELTRATRFTYRRSSLLSEGIKLSYIARSGFYGACALLVDDRNNYDALTESWAKAEVFSRESESFFKRGSFVVRIEDELGKIPINKLVAGNGYNQAVKELLIRLLGQPEFKLDQGKINEIVDSIKDWLDKDDEVTGSGAESNYYRSLAKPYSPKNGVLDCLDDLLMVKGITRTLFYGSKDTPALRDYLTVYGEGMVNINTAPPLVLRALGKEVSLSFVEEMVAYRLQEGVDLSRADWFRNLPGAENVHFDYPFLGVKSDYFTITSIGTLGKMRKRIVASVKRTGGKTVELLSWVEE